MQIHPRSDCYDRDGAEYMLAYYQQCRVSKSPFFLYVDTTHMYIECISVVDRFQFLLNVTLPDRKPWFLELRSDDKKLRAAMDSFRKHRDGVEAGSKSKWLIATFEEAYKATSTLELNRQGEMMCERRFLVWAQDSASIVLLCLLYLICVLILAKLFSYAKDPSQCTWPKVLSYPEALAMWQAWIADPKGSGLPMEFDDRGEVMEVGVPVRKLFNDKTAVIREKTLRGEIAKVKKPDQDTINKYVSKLQLSHDKMGAASIDMMAQMKNVIGQGGGNSSFHGVAATMPDITALAPMPRSDDELSESSAEEATKEVQPPKQIAKKKKRGDWEGFLVKKEHEIEKMITDSEKEVKSASESLVKEVELLQGYSIVDRGFYKNEILLARACLDACDALFSNDLEQLTSYKAHTYLLKKGKFSNDTRRHIRRQISTFPFR